MGRRQSDRGRVVMIGRHGGEPTGVTPGRVLSGPGMAAMAADRASSLGSCHRFAGSARLSTPALSLLFLPSGPFEDVTLVLLGPRR